MDVFSSRPGSPFWARPRAFVSRFGLPRLFAPLLTDPMGPDSGAVPLYDSDPAGQHFTEGTHMMGLKPPAPRSGDEGMENTPTPARKSL